MANLTTLPKVNAALQAQGYDERLAFDRRSCYFYFYGGRAHTWTTSGVYVARVTQLTVQQWIDQRNKLAQTAARHG